MLNSIVIPTYNRSDFLESCLNSLSKQPHMEMETVVVVDDCSDNPHADINKSVCSHYGVNYVRHASNRGQAAARNTGLQAVESAWVTFLDDDVRVNDTWYAELLEKIRLVPSCVAGLEGRTISKGQGLWDKEVENLSGGSFITANISYRREYLQKAGFFDERFGSYNEDCDLAIRIQRYGKILFVPGMCVTHSPRQVNLWSYLLSSCKRIRKQLDSELLLFMKDRDRYHTCRYRANFWATYYDIVTRLLLTTLRRREPARLAANPLSTLVLFISTIIEQIYAGLMFPRLASKFLAQNPFDDPSIDRLKTASINNISLKWINKMRLSPNVHNAPFFRIHKRPVYTSKRQVRHFSKTAGISQSSVFVRFDDVFLHNTTEFPRFMEFVEKSKFPFLAGITARDLSNRHHWEVANRLQRAGAIIGLHGFEHDGKFGPFTSEILQMTYGELHDRLTRLFSKLPKQLHTHVFIPPFNAISREQVIHLASRFKVICGGPESVRFTWRIGCLTAFEGGSFYFPSLPPFYSSAKEMLQNGVVEDLLHLQFPICLTFHMNQEATDDFKAVSTIINSVHQRIQPWQSIWE